LLDSSEHLRLRCRMTRRRLPVTAPSGAIRKKAPIVTSIHASCIVKSIPEKRIASIDPRAIAERPGTSAIQGGIPFNVEARHK